jgi:hypothetical protein
VDIPHELLSQFFFSLRGKEDVFAKIVKVTKDEHEFELEVRLHGPAENEDDPDETHTFHLMRSNVDDMLCICYILPLSFPPEMIDILSRAMKGYRVVFQGNGAAVCVLQETILLTTFRYIELTPPLNADAKECLRIEILSACSELISEAFSALEHLTDSRGIPNIEGCGKRH